MVAYEGMLAETVAFQGHGGDKVSGYLARPLGGGPYPGVIVIHEVFLHHIFCARLDGGFEDGFFIESCKHGSGMSTFTIAPSLAWRIKDGKVTDPVRIAVITGTVFETMGEIDGLSDTVEQSFKLGGGCGKFEQWPLSVGFGGPYVRIRRMNVA